LRNSLVVVVAAILALNAIGIIISIVAELPTEFDTKADPDNVPEDSITKGTLIAAPVVILIVLAGCALLAGLRPKWLATLGLAVLVVLGVVGTIGILGEPLHPEASDPPVAFLVIWKAMGIGLLGALVALSLANLYYVWRPAACDAPA